MVYIERAWHSIINEASHATLVPEQKTQHSTADMRSTAAIKN